MIEAARLRSDRVAHSNRSRSVSASETRSFLRATHSPLQGYSQRQLLARNAANVRGRAAHTDEFTHARTHARVWVRRHARRCGADSAGESRPLARRPLRSASRLITSRRARNTRVILVGDSPVRPPFFASLVLSTVKPGSHASLRLRPPPAHVYTDDLRCARLP